MGAKGLRSALPDGSDTARHSVSERKKVSDMIEEINGLDMSSPAWFQKFKGLCKYIVYHLDKEEQGVFPHSRKRIKQARATTLAGEVGERKTVVVGNKKDGYGHRRTWSMSRPQKYADIDFKPPEKVAENAARGLELRRDHGRGGTMVGVARARDLKNRENISPETVRRMSSYFARHEVDKEAQQFHDEDEPSAGYIAWLLWGGDEGRVWADAIKTRMDKIDEDNS